MTYQFCCEEHGLFEVKQPILSEHKANCPTCGKQAQRIYSRTEWIWAGSAYRPDGSLREDNDYARLKG
jgi:putative FmdB family regulatory protein